MGDGILLKQACRAGRVPGGGGEAGMLLMAISCPHSEHLPHGSLSASMRATFGQLLQLLMAIGGGEVFVSFQSPDSFWLLKLEGRSG